MNDRERVAREEVDIDELHARLEEDDPEALRSAMASLRAASSRDPDALLAAFDRLVELLEHPDEEVRAGAALAIAGVASLDASRVADRLSAVERRLDDGYDVVRWNALKVFRAVAPADPDAVRPHAEAVAAFLDSTFPEARRDAAFCLGNLSIEHPKAVVEAGAIPGLASVFAETPGNVSRSKDVPIQMKRDVERDPDDRFEDEREAIRNGRVAAGHALFEAATVAPEGVVDHLKAVRSVLEDDEPLVREAAADVVFGVASRRPGAATDCVDALGERLAVENVGAVRESLVRALNAISVASPEEVGAVAVARAGAIRELLDADEPAVRGAATGLLALAGERDRGVLEPASDRLRELAESDDAEYVREAAQAALAHVET